jgi:uncharacterized ion transporter superfamily protein YfcC
MLFMVSTGSRATLSTMSGTAFCSFNPFSLQIAAAAAMAAALCT